MIALLLNRYVFGFIGVTALALASMFAWSHLVAEPYRAQGRAEMKAKMQPQLDGAVAALAESAKAMAVLKANSERLKQQAAQAQRVKIVRQDVEKTRVEIIEKFVPVGDTECARTSDAIKRVLR